MLCRFKVLEEVAEWFTPLELLYELLKLQKLLNLWLQ